MDNTQVDGSILLFERHYDKMLVCVTHMLSVVARSFLLKKFQGISQEKFLGLVILQCCIRVLSFENITNVGHSNYYVCVTLNEM